MEFIYMSVSLEVIACVWGLRLRRAYHIHECVNGRHGHCIYIPGERVPCYILIL